MPSPTTAMSKPAMRRSDEARSVGQRRIDGDGVGQVFAAVDHLHEKRLARRHVEGIDQSLQRGESDDFRQIDTVRERESGER